jgi:hypothetical protein
MFFAIAEHIARILLASDPQWRPRGECLHDVAHSRSHFMPDYGMQIRACSSARTASPQLASHAYQEPAASPRASTSSPPSSPGFVTEAWYKEWGRYLHFASVLLDPSYYKLCILCSGGRTHAHGMAKILLCGFIV